MRRITERRARIYALILMTGLLTMFLWIGFLAIKGAGGPIHTSFGTYYAASTLAATGHAELAYDDQSLNQTRKALGAPQADRWSYPPDILLLTTPLAHIPPVAAYGLWVGLLTIAYLLALRAILPMRGLEIVALCFMPWYMSTLSGQNGALSAAIVGAGLVLLDRRPMASGLTLGALTYKPHLVLLVPVVLIATKRWMQLFGFLVSAALLAITSAAIFGFDTWWAFFHHSSGMLQILRAGALQTNRMPTVMGSLLMMNVPSNVALGVQIVAATAAAITAIAIWRSNLSVRLKAASLPAAMLLCTPYVWDYDLTMLAVSGAFLVAEARENGWLGGEKGLMIAAWAVAPVLLVMAFLGVQLGLLLVALPLLLVLRRMVASRQIPPMVLEPQLSAEQP